MGLEGIRRLPTVDSNRVSTVKILTGDASISSKKLMNMLAISVRSLQEDQNIVGINEVSRNRRAHSEPAIVNLIINPTR